MLKKFFLSLIGLSFLTCTQNAMSSPFGISYSIPAITKDPGDFHGYRTAMTYQPSALIWRHFNIFFDAAYSHWNVSGAMTNRQLNIYSATAIFRIYAVKGINFSPFFDISIGPAYLSNTRIDDRNLGMHFAFQDQVGLGVSVGKDQNFSISLSTMHYSNGSMCRMNAGITIPLMVNLSYRF